MNRLTIIGNLTADPETRTANNGSDVCNFTVAVNRRKKIEGQPDADFFRVAAWGQMGENCQKYLHKSSKVAVTGSISAKAYTANDGSARATLELYAEDVEFMGSSNAHQEHSGAPAPTPVDVPDGELPF